MLNVQMEVPAGEIDERKRKGRTLDSPAGYALCSRVTE